MQITCPMCRETIPAADVALDKGWAKCVVCNEIFQLAELLPGYADTSSATSVAKPERPFDSWAEVTRENRRMLIHIPAAGMRAGTWAMLGFATVWLGFIAFWTAGALGVFFGGGLRLENALFAAFSTPFWLAGFGMLGGVVWNARGSRVALLDESKFIGELRCLFWKRRKMMDRAQVQYAREGAAPVKNHNPQQDYSPYPVEIVFKTGSFKLPCQTEAEQRWLIAEINNFLQTVPYRPSPLLDASERL